MSGSVPAEAPVVSVPRSLLETYAGDYRASLGPARVTVNEAGELSMAVGGQRPVRLLPTSETEFRVDGIDARVVFHGDPGDVTHLVIHQAGREIRADRQ